MNLLNLCSEITGKHSKLLPPNHQLGTRLVCPEYSKSVQEVKTYPLLEHDRLFALCWHITKEQGLFATMRPSPLPFCYHYPLFAHSKEKTQLHTHDYIELAYIVEGKFHQKISGKNIIFETGEFCLIDKNCLHQDYLVNEPTTILFLGIANDMFAEIIDENITTQKIISFLQSALLKQKDLQQYIRFKPKTSNSEYIEQCLFTILSELCRNDSGSRYICKGLLIRIFRLLSTEYEFSLSRDQQKTMNWMVFEEISDYINNHYASITIQDLVNTFHFQEDYFNRLIKNKTGFTYSEYVQNIRLSRARHLLLSTQKTIDDIANEVGYNNKGYFYKIFQKKYGMTPRQFRMIN